MYLCAKHVANWEGEGWGHAPPGEILILDLLLDAIW